MDFKTNHCNLYPPSTPVINPGHTFWKTTFTRDCINHDREAICSGAFLTKATAFDAAEKIGKTLHEFVVALFDSGKPEVIAEKRDEFTKSSAEISNLIDALRKELEI